MARCLCTPGHYLAKFLEGGGGGGGISCKALIFRIMNIVSSKTYRGYKGMMRLHHGCSFTGSSPFTVMFQALKVKLQII